MNRDTKVAKADWKFVKVDPDPNFSASHNRNVVDEVIRETEALNRKKKREFREGMGERSSAAAQYLKSVDQGNSAQPEKYFGKKYLAYLRGVEILEKLKANAT